jgi:hypothetical protein
MFAARLLDGLGRKHREMIENRYYSKSRVSLYGAESMSINPKNRSRLEETVSIWLAVIFIVANVAYFLLIPALGLEGQPSQGWMWAVVPVIDMLYIAVQAFCLILSGARSNVFGFTDIAVSWASSVIMGVLACWALFSPSVSLSPFQTMVLVCNLVAAAAESGLTQFGRMAFSKRIIGFGG